MPDGSSFERLKTAPPCVFCVVNFSKTSPQNPYVKEIIDNSEEQLKTILREVPSEQGKQQMIALVIKSAKQSFDLLVQNESLRRENEYLKEREILLKNLLDQVADSVMITDTNGIIEYVNPYFRELTGYDKDEAIGKTPSFLSSGENPDVLYQDMWTTIQSGQAWRGVFTNKKKDGSLYIEEVTIAPIKNTQGEILKYFAIKRDITEAQEIQNALMQAKEVAESASATKTAFLANISHELRTPLNAIIGFSDQNMPIFSEEKAKEYMNYIHTAGENLLELINSLLDITRIEAGQMEVYLEQEQISPVVESCIRILNVLAQKKEIQIKIPEQLQGMAVIDVKKFQQVLTNIISNAIKYSSEGTSIYITEEQSETSYTLIIQDEGKGMTEKELEHAMEPFNRIDARLSAETQGTGLGLTLCDEFMKLQKGEMKIKSEKGKGTTVYLTFPTA